MSGQGSMGWFWPSVANLPDAVRASDQAFWAAVFVAAMTAVLATLAVTTHLLPSLDASAYIDAFLFALIAWRIKRRSRAFAIVGLVLFIVEKAFQFVQTPPAAAGGIFMTLFLLLMFVSGVRGNYAIRRFSAVTAQPAAGA